MLLTVRTFEVIFAFIPVYVMLKLFRFSQDFGERMIYPLVALFFGTGNQTPFISCAILERVFLDPSMKLFEFDEKSLLASIPEMYGFPNVGRLPEVEFVYWADGAVARDLQGMAAKSRRGWKCHIQARSRDRSHS